jgi:hypothetical protein
VKPDTLCSESLVTRLRKLNIISAVPQLLRKSKHSIRFRYSSTGDKLYCAIPAQIQCKLLLFSGHYECCMQSAASELENPDTGSIFESYHVQHFGNAALDGEGLDQCLHGLAWISHD